MNKYSIGDVVRLKFPIENYLIIGDDGVDYVVLVNDCKNTIYFTITKYNSNISNINNKFLHRKAKYIAKTSIINKVDCEYCWKCYKIFPFVETTSTWFLCWNCAL